jgi:glycosyltransferase 2 family protein
MSSKEGRGSRARHARIVLFVAGVGLAAVLVWKTGWPAIQANLASIGWWFVGLVALYLVAEIAFVLGWRSVMEPRPPLRSLPELLRIYLVGNTLNYLAPGSVAGEPVRVSMLRHRMETPAAIASVAIFKHAHLLSQAFFVATGLGVAVTYFELPNGVRWAALASLGILCGLLLLMTWGLQKGTFGPILTFLSRFKPLALRLAHYREGAYHLDELIKRFYARRRPHFLAAAGWCLLGWCGGLVETYIVLRLLAPGHGWETAFAVEGLAMLLNNIFLFVPGRAGTAEGVRTGVFALLGMAASTGVAYGLVRRARELLWVTPGLLSLSHHPVAIPHRKPASEKPPLARTEQGR